MTTLDATNLTGSTLSDRYYVHEEIGRGAMSVVYRAHDSSLNIPVALKVMAPHLVWDREFEERFRREAQAVAQLDHPNIVRVYNIEKDRGVHYIVVAYLQGITLAEWVRTRGPMPLDQVVPIVSQIASALDYAHARDMVHRDIKPANIMVSSQGQATLLDFGLVKAVEGPAVTKAGTVMGTPAYMSPEQIMGQPTSKLSDIYSLGLVTYEMLTGDTPFRGDTSALLYQQVHTSPRPLREINGAVSENVSQVVLHALAKDPGARWPGAGAFAKALQDASRGIPVVPPGAAPGPPADPSPPPRPWWVIAVLALLALVVGCAIAWRVWSGATGGDTTATPTPGGSLVVTVTTDSRTAEAEARASETAAAGTKVLPGSATTSPGAATIAPTATLAPALPTVAPPTVTTPPTLAPPTLPPPTLAPPTAVPPTNPPPTTRPPTNPPPTNPPPTSPPPTNPPPTFPPSSPEPPTPGPPPSPLATLEDATPPLAAWKLTLLVAAGYFLGVVLVIDSVPWRWRRKRD